MNINLGEIFTGLNGYKTHALGGFAIVVGVLKLMFDMPDVETISVLGVSAPWALLTTGWGVVAGRIALNKLL